MIIGVGCDVVEVGRVRSVLERRGEDFVDCVLSKYEKNIYQARSRLSEKRGVLYLATRWAAKEALSKAFGTGIRGAVTFKVITVKNNELGAPYFEFEGELAEHVLGQKIVTHLTISDSETVCMAVAVCERISANG